MRVREEVCASCDMLLNQLMAVTGLSQSGAAVVACWRGLTTCIRDHHQSAVQAKPYSFDLRHVNGISYQLLMSVVHRPLTQRRSARHVTAAARVLSPTRCKLGKASCGSGAAAAARSSCTAPPRSCLSRPRRRIRHGSPCAPHTAVSQSQLGNVRTLFHLQGATCSPNLKHSLITASDSACRVQPPRAAPASRMQCRKCQQ